jgi:hypothetical protein
MLIEVKKREEGRIKYYFYSDGERYPNPSPFYVSSDLAIISIFLLL